VIRGATPADVGTLLALVHDLAAYEKSPDQVAMREADLHAALFGPDPVASCEVAETGDGVVGMALWFTTFSTWTGVAGIHLEDLYVRPEERGAGHGRALLARLAGICVARGYPRLEWNVLDWNAPAIGFYRSLGAAPLEDWTTFRLVGASLAALASGGPGARGPRR
jgi:GNAT superfamily N-acetyltransferase